MHQENTVDNNKLANLILSKRLATVDQIKIVWPQLTPSKNIGMVLVENGIIPQMIYSKIYEFFLKSSGAGAPPASDNSTRTETRTEPAQTNQQSQGQRENTVITRNQGQSDGDMQQPVPGEGGSLPTLSMNHSLQDMLKYTRIIDASDIHLSPNTPVTVRKYGKLLPLTDTAMHPQMIKERIQSILSDTQKSYFEKKGDLEFVYCLEGGGRFRVTIMKQRHGWDLTARCIPMTIRSFEEIGMPESCRELTQWAQGLVLITGPACCGKTTSLITLIDLINRSRYDHIITLESPIEYIFTSTCAQITQREIGKDSVNQEAALRAALREDPDIIVVGELRDLSTIQLAVTAAETGHLVFATMNTISASRTIYRLIDSFPPEEQSIMRNMISESLRGIISQQLIPRKDNNGMVAAFEVLVVNSAVANMIRKDEAHQLGTAMITGKAAGMRLLDDSLKLLAAQEIIGEEEVTTRSMIYSPLTVK